MEDKKILVDTDGALFAKSDGQPSKEDERMARDLLALASGKRMPQEQRLNLIAAYREALSSDEIARDFHKRNWTESATETAVRNLPRKFREKAKQGLVQIHVADYVPLDDKALAVLKEFFTERLETLEIEEKEYLESLCEQDKNKEVTEPEAPQA